MNKPLVYLISAFFILIIVVGSISVIDSDTLAPSQHSAKKSMF